MQNKVYTLVTGASEGLGKAIALECASREYESHIGSIARS